MLLLFALLQMDPAGSLLKWMDSIAQSQLDARDKAIAQIRTREQAIARQKEVKAKLLGLLGGLPTYDGPLNARIAGRIDADGYTIEKVVFESLPKYYVTANLYLPKGRGPHPGILFPLGHWDQGKAIAQRMGGNFALKGFVVLAYDPVGQGERLQAYDPRTGRSLAGGSTEQHILNGAQSILVGETFARYRIWDAKRALDYLVSRPEVDKNRVGCTGCSGGGTVTTYISALDDRIKVAAPSCYMNSWRKLFSGPTGDSEQSLDRFLASGLDMTDYVELFAPKPWLMTSTEQDYFTPAGAKIVYDEAKQWYSTFGAEDRVKWVVGPGGHGTPAPLREEIYGWMLRWLKDKDGSPNEVDIPLRPDHEFQVTKSGQVAVEFKSRDTYEVIRERLEKSKHDSSTAELTAAMKTLVDHHPALSVKQKPNGVMEIGVDRDLAIDARVFRPQQQTGKAAAVLIVGRTKGNEELAGKLSAAGEVALILPPRGTPMPASNNLSGDWITNTRALLIGRNLPAMRAHDILCGVDLLASMPEVDASRIRLIASDAAGVWALIAAAVDSRIAAVELERTPYSVRAALNAPLTRGLHDVVIPGFALRWDLADFSKAIAPRKVIWRDPTDWMRNVQTLPGYEYSSFAQ